MGSIPVEPGPSPIWLSEANRLAAEGRTFQTAGYLCVGVGAAALAGGALWWWLGRPAPVEASVAVGAHGGSVSLSGRF
jgi:hypothetical protein